MIFRSVIFFFLIFFSNVIYGDNFVPEKECPLYKIDKDNQKKVGRLEKNQQYKFKEYEKIDKKNYAVIANDNDEFFVKSNCGFQKFENQPKLEKIFSEDEVGKLELTSDFDKEIISYCGYFGSHPTREQFIEIMQNEKYRGVFERIYEKLNKKIFPQDSDDKDEFLLNLANLLFQNNGFNHVVCGFVKGDKMAGPHYHYRFLDLQKNNFIGQNEEIKKCNSSKDENGKISNYPVVFFDSQKKLHVKCNNSFIKDMPVEDIIVIGALSGKIKSQETANTNGTRKKTMIKSCVYNSNDNLFKIVYNTKNKALITLYPIVQKNKYDGDCEFESQKFVEKNQQSIQNN